MNKRQIIIVIMNLSEGDDLREFFKKLTVVFTVLSLIIFSVIYVGEKIIPNEITIIDDYEINIPEFFGLDIYNIKNKYEFSNAAKVKGIQEKSTEIKLFNIIPVKNTVITNSERKYVVLGGELFGIKLYTDGVIVVDLDEIETENGKVSPGKNSGLKVGDIIISINNINITSASHLSKIIQESKGQEIKIKFKRGEVTKETHFNTVKEINTKKYKAGLWVRDSTAGLGTVTFYNTENNTFGGLGHPIYDVDTNEIMPIKSGNMANVKLSGIYKSSFGNVGELCGVFTGENTGILCLNDETGIYGYTETDKTNKIPVAVKQEISEGEAQIFCTVKDSEPEYYEIEITRIYSNSTSVNKDMIIKITDEKLLEYTGGIVQGMSGSPIIQNGRLVGAVTHVFVNNPKQGYAIFAERMLETSNSQKLISTKK